MSRDTTEMNAGVCLMVSWSRMPHASATSGLRDTVCWRGGERVSEDQSLGVGVKRGQSPGEESGTQALLQVAMPLLPSSHRLLPHPPHLPCHAPVALPLSVHYHDPGQGEVVSAAPRLPYSSVK